MKRWINYIAPSGILGLLFLLIASFIALGSSGQSVFADEPSAERPCSAAVVVDRSGSVSNRQLNTLQRQIKRLFQAPKWTPSNPSGGLYDPNIYLAFWSFSHQNSGRSNYNDPYNDYVPTNAPSSSFDRNLSRLLFDSSGLTNYEQGFGYNLGTRNPYDDMPAIINRANIIVFMTDGLPNKPGFGDNNSDARNAGRTAVLKHLAAGKIVVGGIIGNEDPGSLNYVINGNDRNGTNTFKISDTYGDLAEKLVDIIGEKCNGRDNPPPPPPVVPYSLTPKVNLSGVSSGGVVSGAGSVGVNYDVDNNGNVGMSGATDWTVYRIVVNKGQSVDPLYYGGAPYRDGYACAQLSALVNNQTTGPCAPIATGNRQFSPNATTNLNTDAGAGATSLVIDDSWQVGTKVCYVLALAKPTNLAAPVNRFSSAKCVTIGVRPMVQVHGGDLRVGRTFDGSSASTSRVVTGLTTKSDGNTYGSWGEYGAFAPDAISGFASLSGFSGGLASSLAASQANWSKLTFANTGPTPGYFANIIGTIPNVKAAFLAQNCVDCNLASSGSFNGASIQSGKYQYNGANFTLNNTVLQRGKTIVLYAPNGTVTIAGNIKYNDDANYRDISEIPQLVIIANRIEINQDVDTVDAWLIADGPATSSANGVIRTCNNNASPTSEVCNKQLRINGPVMARHLELKRNAVGTGRASDTPAEIINLNASSYLWAWGQGSTGVRAETTFTTELPPYF